MRMQTIAAGNRRTRHAAWQGLRVRSPPPAQVSRYTSGGRGAEMGFRRLLCRAALALTMPCQCQPRRGARSVVLLQRVPRLEVLLRVSTLHERLKENRLRAERNSKVKSPSSEF